MEKDTRTIRSVVLGILGELLEGCHDSPINDSDIPVGNLGLDSEDEIEFICMVERDFEIPIEADCRPLVDDERGRGRTVNEIIRFVETLIRETQEE